MNVPSLVLVFICNFKSFQSCAPVLVMKVSAMRVFTLGILKFVDCLVGYRWIELLVTNKLSKIGGRRELLYLYMNIATFIVYISDNRKILYFLQTGRVLVR